MKKKPLFVLLPVMIFTKAIGGIRDVMFLSVFGSGEIAAVYEGTERFVSLFYDITVGAAAGSILIPLLCQIGVKHGGSIVGKFAAFYMMICEGVCVLSSVLALFMNSILGICGDYALFFILSMKTVISGLLFTLASFLNFNSDFVLPALAPSFSSVAVVLYLLIGGKSIYHVAALDVFFVFFSCMALTVHSRRDGLRLSFMPKYAWGYMASAAKKLLPVSLSMQFMPCTMLIAVSLVMHGGKDIISFSYGSKIFVAGVGTIIFAFSQVLYTEISKLTADGKIAEAKNRCMKTILLVFGISLLGIILALTAGKKIIHTVFCHGALSNDVCEKIAEVFTILLFAMPAVGAGEVSFRMSVASGKNLAILLSSVLGLSLFIPLLTAGDVPNVITICYTLVISTYLRAVCSCIFVFGGKYIAESDACDNRPKHRGCRGFAEKSDGGI